MFAYRFLNIASLRTKGECMNRTARLRIMISVSAHVFNQQTHYIAINSFRRRHDVEKTLLDIVSLLLSLISTLMLDSEGRHYADIIVVYLKQFRLASASQSWLNGHMQAFNLLH